MSSTFGPSVDPTLPPLRHNRAPAGSLRIAVDLSLLRPRGENGGIKPFAFEYIRELARVEGTAITFVFLTWSCSHDEVRALARPHDELVCVRHTDHSPLSEVSGWREGETLWLNPPPTLLVHLQVSLLYSPLSSAEFACPGIPLVATIADVLHRDYPLTLEPHVVAHREAIFQDLVKVADRFQCISSHTAGRLIELFGVDPARTFRTYIVIQERLGRTNTGGARPIPEKYFFFPANAWHHKNHKTLLVAYRLYRHLAGPDAWELVLTGHDDDAMRGVLASAQSLGIAEHVRFFGHLSETEFAAVWRHAGAMVFPSLHEGFGIPLLEAMHFGIPVLSSPDTSLSEIGGGAVLFADPRAPDEWARSMVEISTDQDLRGRLVAAGNSRLADFSLSAEASAFQRTLREVASRGSDRLWSKGIHIDGWTEHHAVVALPAQGGATKLTINIAPMPADRRLRLSRGLTPFGGFSLAAGIPHQVCVEMELNGDPLLLEIPDATNLNPADHRAHGVLVGSITIGTAAGELVVYPHRS